LILLCHRSPGHGITLAGRTPTFPRPREKYSASRVTGDLTNNPCLHGKGIADEIEGKSQDAMKALTATCPARDHL
jgi:hypothetical protein